MHIVCTLFGNVRIEVRDEKDRVKPMLIEIEENIESRKQTDRTMWFSMWVLLSIVSFGIAWFLMIYFLIKRRNDHFTRQKKLETLILRELRQLNTGDQVHATNTSRSTKQEILKSLRNAPAWTLSTLLIVPTFYVLRFLMVDLRKHEEQQRLFFMEVVSLADDPELSAKLDGLKMPGELAVDKYVVFSLVTFGCAALYWLYRIFNDYNRHFKAQWQLEDELCRYLKVNKQF
jgi:hypothetical protein